MAVRRLLWDPASSKGGQVRLVVASAGLGLTVFVLTGCASAAVSSSSPAARDVYCLVDANPAELVHAAETLGLARAGSAPATLRTSPESASLSVGQWSKLHSRSFQRACDTLIAANMLSSSQSVLPGPEATFSSTADVLLPVVVGALLTLLTTQWTGSRQRRRLEAARLRDSSAHFVQSIADYVYAWTAPTVTVKPSMQYVDQRRRELAFTLRRLQAIYGSVPLATDLLRDIEGDKYRSQRRAAGRGGGRREHEAGHTQSEGGAGTARP